MELNVSIKEKSVPVMGDEATLQQAVDSTLFQDWIKNLDDRFVVTSIVIQSIDLFGQRVGFVKWNAEIADANGNRLPGIVFGRGPAVAVLMILSSEGRDYVLLTSQARAAIGTYAHDEIIAGMTDGDGNLTGVAAKEVRQETSLVLSAADLFELSSSVAPGVPGIYTSPGGCDEYLRYYLFRKEVDQAFISELQGKLTGVAEENEYITLKILPLVTACQTLSDGKFWTAYGLYQAALGQGRILL